MPRGNRIKFTYRLLLVLDGLSDKISMFASIKGQTYNVSMISLKSISFQGHIAFYA